jgi:hypothetical protein
MLISVFCSSIVQLSMVIFKKFPSSSSTTVLYKTVCQCNNQCNAIKILLAFFFSHFKKNWRTSISRGFHPFYPLAHDLYNGKNKHTDRLVFVKRLCSQHAAVVCQGCIHKFSCVPHEAIVHSLCHDYWTHFYFTQWAFVSIWKNRNYYFY